MAFRSRETEVWTDTLREWKPAAAPPSSPDLSGTFAPKLSSHPLAGRGAHTYPNTRTFSSPTADAKVQIARARRNYQAKLARLVRFFERADCKGGGVVAPAQVWRGLQEVGIDLPDAFVEGVLRRSMFGDNAAAPKLGLRPEVNWRVVVHALRNVHFDLEPRLGEAALLQVAHECARSVNGSGRGAVQSGEVHQLFKTLDKVRASTTTFLRARCIGRVAADAAAVRERLPRCPCPPLSRPRTRWHAAACHRRSSGMR
jgi:hypothetical protein